MSKYGTKYACWSCGARFYDLNKPDPVCPKCGADPKAAPETRPPSFDDEDDETPVKGDEEE